MSDFQDIYFFKDSKPNLNSAPAGLISGFAFSDFSSQLRTMNPFLPEKPDENASQSLESVVRARVTDWLRNDFNFLVNALYRLDISETRVKAALALPDEEAIVRQLTYEILLREKQKMDSRARYRTQNSPTELPE